MFKNWFLLASVSCGVGFGSTFLINRNLQQSTLAGLGTVPAVAASMAVLSRQRREEIERQVVKSKVGLDYVRAQEQLAKDSCQEISAHGQKLQTGFTQLRQDVDRYRERQASLEQEINSLVLQKQAQESLLVQLDVKVLDRQNNLQTTQAELTRIQNQRQSDITSSTTRLNDSARQSNLELQRIREEIRQYSAINRQLEAQINDLQNRSQSLQKIVDKHKIDLSEIKSQIAQGEVQRNQASIDIADLDKLLQQKQSILQGIAPQQQSLQQQISDLLLQKQDQKVLFDNLVVNISTKRNNLLELDD
jgi:chromosome segregation ATPase